jgi:hypothetical protein
MFLVGLAAERVVDIVHPKKWRGGVALTWLKRLSSEKHLLIIGAIFILTAVALNASGIVDYVARGYDPQHWSRVAFGLLLSLAALQFFSAALLERTLRMLGHLATIEGRGVVSRPLTALTADGQRQSRSDYTAS